jgi:hypothetical protein
MSWNYKYVEEIKIEEEKNAPVCVTYATVNANSLNEDILKSTHVCREA